MAIPPGLIRLIHTVLVTHYRKHHGADDLDRAEVFAENFADKLLGPLAIADASKSAADLDIRELPRVAAGADEQFHFAGLLRESLARDVRRWLEEAGIWRYSAKLKAKAFANGLAGLVDGETYATAVANAKLGRRPADSDDRMSGEEARAIAAEGRYQGWRGRW